MRRYLLPILVFSLLFTLCAPAFSEGSFVVDDGEDTPDPNRQARAMMQRMTDTEKIYQLFFVAPEDLTGEERTVSLPPENVLKEKPVGGVMIFGQNIESADQLLSLTADLNRFAAQARLYPLFIGVDEEGGLVSRVANKLGYPLAKGPNELGATGDEEAALAAGRQIADYLRPLGVNMTFSPPLDTLPDQDNPGVQSFGEDPQLVYRLASFMAQGLREGGVLPCFTHFPGHGAKEGTTSANISIKRTLDEMRAQEWVPFQIAIDNGAEMILVSHGRVRVMGDDMPASCSSIMIDAILRNQMGFQGVVVTDSLRMRAVTSYYKTGQECVAALKAGADILLLPPDLEKAVSAIQKALASGEITMERVEESVQRILAVKIRMSMIQD